MLPIAQQTLKVSWTIGIAIAAILMIDGLIGNINNFYIGFLMAIILLT